MDTQFFNFRTCGGMSGKSSEFKNSVGFYFKFNTSTPQYTGKLLQSIYCTEIKKEEVNVVYGVQDSRF
jgi:hypothetical protein